jgi:hypothetical protein
MVCIWLENSKAEWAFQPWTLLVQVIEPPAADKRARISTRLALEGANVVLLPGGKGASVSKRISAAKREALQGRAHTFLREGEGLVLRGGALEIDDARLGAEIDALRAKAAAFVRDGAPGGRMWYAHSSSSRSAVCPTGFPAFVIAVRSSCSRYSGRLIVRPPPGPSSFFSGAARRW